MQILESLWNEIVSFLGVKPVIEILLSGNYSKFSTYEGFTTIIYPLIPFLLIIEIILGIIHKKPHTKVYKVSFLIYILNRVISRFVSLGIVGFIIANFQKYAPFQTTFTWYWFIYGYVVWEFSHYIYHYLGHKVRLFWCFHATHHAPEDMNLSVTYAHFFLEGAYADTIRAGICILAGIEPAMLFTIMFVDGTWGAFIHVGEHLFKDGRLGIHKLGFIGKMILSPSDHRVHHARNPLYMDTNFCNLINIWDRVFGTYQPEQEHIQIEYGITRPIDSGNLWQVYFGEFFYLIKDIIEAPGIKNKFFYLIKPPGWHHSGNYKTAEMIKAEYKQNHLK